MNVLHVIDSMNPASGGPCQGIRNSMKVLADQIANREVVCMDDPASSYLGKDSFTIHALGPARNPWRYSVKLSLWLKENLPRFDVVVINGLWLYHAYAASKAVRQLNKAQKAKAQQQLPKLFVMPHGMLDPYFQRAPERKLKAARNWLYWKLIESEVVNSANGLLFTCETEMQLAREPFRPYKPKKEINVGYGIVAPPPLSEKMHAAFYQKCPIVKDRPFLLFISRIHRKKGVDLLLNAYASVLQEKSSNELPLLVIAGPGLETAYGQAMGKMVKEHPRLSSTVCFPGMLTGSAKWGAFYNCEAFILPSHQENFGIAVAEAMACRKPVLISNQVNIWSEIDAEGAGFVASDSVEGTKQLLRNWLQLTAEQKADKGGRALHAYQNYFAAEQAAQKFFSAISS